MQDEDIMHLIGHIAQENQEILHEDEEDYTMQEIITASPSADWCRAWPDYQGCPNNVQLAEVHLRVYRD